MALYLFLLFFTIPVSHQVADGFEFSYAGLHSPNTTISFNGVAQIHTNGLLQLTNETSRLIGHAFYPSPIQFKNSTAVSTCFAFSIHPEYPKLGGHGMAFTVATSKELHSALPSQYLGLNSRDGGNSSNHLFAVGFDTVQDFEFGDINDNHVGIDLNSLVSNASASPTYDGGSNDLNLKSGKPILVWIEYDSLTNLVNVTLSPSSSKPETPILCFPVDLSPIFEENMFIGFSASTGLLASSHYILGWSFKLNGEAKTLDLDSLPTVPGTKRKRSALTLGLSIAAAALVMISIAIAVFLIRKFKNSDIIEAWSSKSDRTGTNTRS